MFKVERVDVATLMQKLSVFATVDPLMSLPQVLTLVRVLELLAVSDDRWVHQRDVASGMPVTPPSVSRGLTYWSKFGDREHHFLELSQDPQDRRQGIVSLTPRGVAFAKTLFSNKRGSKRANT